MKMLASFLNNFDESVFSKHSSASAVNPETVIREAYEREVNNNFEHAQPILESSYMQGFEEGKEAISLNELQNCNQ